MLAYCSVPVSSFKVSVWHCGSGAVAQWQRHNVGYDDPRLWCSEWRINRRYISSMRKMVLLKEWIAWAGPLVQGAAFAAKKRPLIAPFKLPSYQLREEICEDCDRVPMLQHFIVALAICNLSGNCFAGHLLHAC